MTLSRLLLSTWAIIAIGALIFGLTRLPVPSQNSRTAIGEKSIYPTPSETVNTRVFKVEYYARGEGPRVVLLPSIGREASDFNELVKNLNDEGYRTIAIEHPGIGNSTALPPNINQFSYPIFKVLETDGYLQDDKPYFLVGHAYGNRLARLTSTYLTGNNSRLPRLSGTILLASGGQVPMEPKAEQALRDIFNPMKSHKARMEDVRYAFFAEGNNIPDHWKRGWHTKTAMAQGKAVAASAGEDSWHCAGGVPMLIVQPMQDRIAPIENAHALRDKCPQEIDIIEIQNAGHALLPEQPDTVADAVLAFLAKHHTIETLEP